MELNYAGEELDIGIEGSPAEGLDVVQWPEFTRFGCPSCKVAHDSDGWTSETQRIYPGDVRQFLEDGRRSKHHFYVCLACGVESVGLETLAPEQEKDTTVVVPTQKKKQPYTLKNEPEVWEGFRVAMNHIFDVEIGKEGLKSYLDTWRTNKGWLFEYMDHNGRLETVFDEPLSQEEFNRALAEVYPAVPTSSLGVPRSSVRGTIILYFKHVILNQFSREEIVTNKVKRVPHFVESLDKVCSEGMKLSKFFQKALRVSKDKQVGEWGRQMATWSTEDFHQAYEWAGVWYSRVVDTLKSGGRKVVLSVNPMDFVTASCHTTGWSSCVHFTDGGYKSSCLSHMLDKASAVAFSYNRAEEYYGAMVPRKSWRQFVYFDREHASALMARQYPQTNTGHEKAVRAMAAHILADELQTPKKWKFKTLEDHGFRLHRHESMYGDPMSSRLVLPGGVNPDLHVGTHMICLQCGEKTGNASFFHKECGNGAVCCICGDHNIHRALNDERYCESCWDEEITSCDDCGEWLRRDDIYGIGCGDGAVCQNCYDNNYFTCEHCDETYHNDDATHIESSGGYVCNHCRNDHYSTCDYCEEWDTSESINLVEGEDKYMCEACHKEHVRPCHQCETDYLVENLEEYEEDGDTHLYCSNCIAEKGDEDEEVLEAV